MPTIRILPDHLISQIAAGEVVERPASVVKELVENSLDAGATEIKVELEAGGKRRITVSDDGRGMGRDDSLLAFDRHATSKIEEFADLEKVATLGFRGEALASIAAVARVELTTAEASGEGHRVRIEGGQVRVAEPAARPRGTTIEVASLFFNVPARRKFLKSPATELRRAVEVVQGYALARPDVRFSLHHQGRALLDALPASSDAEGARERIGQIFGVELSRSLVEIPGLERDDGERIWGFVGDPSTTRGRRLFVFVNRRLLRDRAVLATFYRSVREVWKKDDFPALFLFLDVPATEVDVNVHPQKAEVRFRDFRLLDRVAETLRRALDDARGEEAAPLRPLDDVPETPFAWQGAGQVRGPVSDNSGARRTNPWSGGEIRERPASGYGEFSDLSGKERPAGAPSSWQPTPSLAASRLATAAYAPLDRPTVPLSGRSGEQRPFRLLGQYKGTLILLEGPDGLYIIDQHVAHERVLYERFKASLRRETPASQRLLEPVLLELAPAERMRLLDLAAELEPRGFTIAELSGGSIALTSIPAGVEADEGERILLRLAADTQKEGDDGIADVERSLLDGWAASLSCRNAVKMHHPLTPEEMESIVAEMFQAENPYACPHGRPTVLKMTDSDLERRFGRR